MGIRDTIASDQRASQRMGTQTETQFVESVCVPLLCSTQNPDGGWGFHPRSESRPEPTCWALQALLQHSWPQIPEAAVRGFRFVRETQLGDGAWPSALDQRAVSCGTAAARWALLT